jgi:hypothetical protein
MIEDYSFGRMTVDGVTYKADVLLYPDHVDASWWRLEGHRLQPEDLKDVFDAQPQVLVVGQGTPGLMRISDGARQAVAERGILLVVARTAEATVRYNELLAQGKKVVGAFHLTC